MSYTHTHIYIFYNRNSSNPKLTYSPYSWSIYLLSHTSLHNINYELLTCISFFYINSLFWTLSISCHLKRKCSGSPSNQWLITWSLSIILSWNVLWLWLIFFTYFLVPFYFKVALLGFISTSDCNDPKFILSLLEIYCIQATENVFKNNKNEYSVFFPQKSI